MKKICSIFLLICLMVSILSIQSTPSEAATNSDSVESIVSDWEGKYDSASTFTISTVNELLAFAELVNDENDPKTFAGKTISLENDLDLTGISWQPIGSTRNTGTLGDNVFSGTFDGKNHTVSNLSFECRPEGNDKLYYDSMGLFGQVSSGIIKNVMVENVDFTNGWVIGAVVGCLKDNGKVENCSASGKLAGVILNSKEYASNFGGIVGQSKGSVEISNCISNVNIQGKSRLGGIIGSTLDGGTLTVSECKNDGSIIGSSELIGGIVGQIQNGTIEICENTGSITGAKSVGGIAGDITEGSVITCENSGNIEAVPQSNGFFGGIVGHTSNKTLKISSCINSGAVNGSTQTGGIVGYLTGETLVDSCSNSGVVTGTESVGGICGKTAPEVGNASETMEILNCFNSGKVSGTSDVGGIVGTHNSGDVGGTLQIPSSAKVSGCLNNGEVAGTTPNTAGMIVGNNCSQGKTETAKSGSVQNNFWPKELGTAAIGGGAGENVNNNSSYDSTTGKLTNPISGPGETTITTLGEALEALNSSGGSATVPDALKVSISFDANGHGSNPASQTVTMGTTVELPAMSNDGYYTFLGWSDGTTTHQAGTEVVIMKNTTFTAQWRNDEPPYTGKYSYEISVAQPDNGSVDVDKYATEGETVTITATSDDGYMLDSLSVTAGGKELEVTDNGDGTYSFTMPSGKVSISAAFAEDPDWVEPEQPEEPSTTVADIFSDVVPGAWYTDAVQYAYDNGLMTGTSATTFEPNTTTTRGMIVSMLHRLEGSPAVGSADFSDVAGGDWYADPVAWAASEGIVGGYGDGTFGPNDPITREQMASILYRYANYKGLDVSARASLDAYSDADSVSPWASDVMSWAVSEGIISGMTEDTLAPQGTATRAQVAAMFQRFLEHVMA